MPSLALFQQALSQPLSTRGSLTLVLADYNPSVLQLVTLPNLVLAWALANRDRLAEAFTLDGELELLPCVLDGFVASLAELRIALGFYSGGWCDEFARMLREGMDESGRAVGAGEDLLVLGAETIYSPFALRAFADTVMDLLRCEQQQQQQQQDANPDGTRKQESATCVVAAKRLYFGVL